jgi:hypothetical protein
MEISTNGPQNLKLDLPHDSAISLGNIMSANENTKDTCKLRFFAILFTLARLWNQSRCPKQING